MIYGDFKFDKKRDISDVPQYGFVDLAECYKNGSVPADIQPSEMDYNGIESAEHVIGKPSDIFEAYRMHSAINGSLSSTTSVSPEGEGAKD